MPSLDIKQLNFSVALSGVKIKDQKYWPTQPTQRQTRPEAQWE